MIIKPSPKGGSGNKEYQEKKTLLEQKKRMYKNLMNKADNLLDAGKTHEARQCIQSANSLEEGIKQLERELDPNTEVQGPRGISIPKTRVTEDPPFPGWPIMRKNEDGELETIGRMNDPTILRRRTV